MKNKIAIASAFLAASSFSTAEIVVNDFLSFEGFVDMSYVHMSGDDETGAIYGDVTPGDYSDNSFAVDQVEISWLFDFDPVTAQIDLTHLGSDNSNYVGTGGNTGVEQAFATYHMDEGSAVTAGMYASMLGFEAFEPTGLYQYSFAYDLGTLLPGYAQGVKYTYQTDTTFFGISLQDTISGAYTGRLGGNDNGNPLVFDDGGFGVEAAFSYYMDDGLSFFLGGAVEDGDDGDSYVVNSYVTYETGAWIFAAELNYGETDIDPYGIAPAGGHDETEVLSALLMANFAYSEAASITGRVSYIDAEQDHTFGGTSFSADGDWIKYTLAHGYAFTDNLFLVTEVSYADGEIDDATGNADGDFDQLSGAVELLFTF